MIYKNVTMETLDKTLKLATENDLDIYQQAGSLLDEYLIINKNIRFKNSKKIYKYIIFREQYLNGWSSQLNLILSDNTKQTEYFNEYDI